MDEQVVTFSKSGKIGTIHLNRPPANSYEIEFMRQFNEAIREANESADVRVVIVRSELPRFFSAGADIKAFMENDTAGNMGMIRFAHSTLDKMRASSKVFIAAIGGHALGGGLEIALACDLRFAEEGNYKLGLPEVTLGLLPGNGGTQRLPRLIGASRALELMITGETVSPPEALGMGLVNRLYPAGQLVEQTESFAGRLASGASLAIRQIKRAVYEGIELPMEEALALERELIEPLFDSEDAREGFSAFAEKRQPVYKGR
jgi:enoyl-CoA hydratase/carnithine racemase